MKAIDFLKNYDYQALDYSNRLDRLDDRILDFKKKVKTYRANEKSIDTVLINNLWQGFNASWGETRRFSSIPIYILKKIDLIFCGLHKNKKIMHDYEFSFQLFVYIDEYKKYSLAKKLINELIKDYDVEYKYFFEYLEILFECILKSDRKSILRLTEKINKYSLLSKNAPLMISQKFIQNLNDIEDIKQELGLYGDFASRGLGSLVIESFSTYVERELLNRNYDVLDVYTSFIIEDGEIIAPQLKKNIFHTLLRPFLNEDPNETVKNKIMKLCDHHLGDPRGKNEKWFSLDSEVKQLVLRWKVGLTLKAFFGIIEYAAKTDPQADRMWKYRRTFWNAYLEDKCITEAWVLLGAVARRNKSAFLEDNVDHGFLGSGVASNHNAILMKIGGLTLCEWSHNGAIRIWDEGNEDAPELYKASYDKYELMRNADFDMAHIQSDRSTWQDKVNSEIQYRTGIKVPKSRYFKK